MEKLAAVAVSVTVSVTSIIGHCSLVWEHIVLIVARVVAVVVVGSINMLLLFLCHVVLVVCAVHVLCCVELSVSGCFCFD